MILLPVVSTMMSGLVMVEPHLTGATLRVPGHLTHKEGFFSPTVCPGSQTMLKVDTVILVPVSF